ncbi:family 43 glycosylhydrolase [Deinococcus yavapaiensis]|uniref:Arabinan endo-1,5-alpha-L-arabinosidase n=1 Tax=Deinococcus yavapaiensis KR-236 TaxID=694435 RepID=A0A318SB35_9DEIO|nr:family 43 glycosylhydrolase [Deinococcus yavapaiensis]PYE55430.1 arabinan endo-1,5-alpha-L-arabinosidase [Deinococcus yavapaiensis KR-236]
MPNLAASFRSLRTSVGFLGALAFGVTLSACQQQASPGSQLAAPPASLSALGADAVGKYRNPLRASVPNGTTVDTCADPSIIQGQTLGDTAWYLYCTTDPLNGQDTNANGDFNFRLMPTLKSTDLVNWTYVGDAFTQRPAWVDANAGLWAPDIEYVNGKYHLYYTASNTNEGGSAIGVAVSDSPTGPWVDSGAPVVEPHPAPCCSNSRRWTFDPDVIRDADGQLWIYYGSYFGGLSVRKLSPDGLKSDPATQVQVAIANRYEGSQVVYRNGFYYLMASASDCCRGPLTGYSVFVGRSPNPTGPFVDRDGVSLLSGRVGGTPVLGMNGNRWVGTGHNAVFTDASGQDWTVYHAVDRNDAYLTSASGLTKRPLMLDPLDWVDGWPVVRGGLWASDQAMPAPSSLRGQPSAYRPRLATNQRTGTLLNREDFDGDLSQWTWVRPPDGGSFRVVNGAFQFDTQAADLFEGSNTASVLTRPAPSGDYVVDVKLSINLPPEGCCFNYVQAGLVIYADDDRYVKLTHASIWETRQIEFAKEQPATTSTAPRYGSTVLGAPADTLWLRIVKSTDDAEQRYTAYSSTNGTTWTRGGTWTNQLGDNARIGLVSMGGSGFTATFDEVRVSRLKP